MKKLVYIVISIIIMIVAFLVHRKLMFKEKEVIIPWTTKIEEMGIRTKQEDKIDDLIKQGKLRASVNSLEEFMSWIPENSLVYTYCEAVSGFNSAKKTYLVFLDVESNKTAIYYEEDYIYQEDGNIFWIDKYDEQTITFYWSNDLEIVRGSVLIILICIVAFIMILLLL